jgi:hypothetical protein
MTRLSVGAAMFAAVAAAACDGRAAVRRAEAASTTDSVSTAARVEAERARQDSIVRARPGYIVDSIRPVEEEIRRFQATIPQRPAAFRGGASSRSALVASFVRALEQRDTTALANLLIDRAEFAYLVYPTSPNARPPYRQAPDLVWMSRSAATDKGYARLMTRFGGKPLHYAGFTCPDPSERQGSNTVWSGCVVARRDGGDTTRLRMFGAIVARDGRFKLLSLSNGL